MRFRWLVLLGLWIAAWLGCSSDGRNSTPRAAGGAAQSAGGRASQGGARASGGAQAGLGGGAGAGGFAGAPVDAAGAGGAAPLPAGWRCIYFTYGNGQCDCGCGAPDIDCSEQDLKHCDVCDSVGGCSLGECPGRIDPDDVTRCIEAPADWKCAPEAYRDGKCDCGCGVLDADCSNSDITSCDSCKTPGSCAHGPCPAALAASDNTRCELPARWACEPETYGDGKCDCGCGVVDVDCPDAAPASCEVCDGRGSCSGTGCDALAPDDNAHCPKPPVSWDCSPRVYNDGSRCDCGCGAVDPDCESTAASACDKCDAPGSCSAQPCPSFINSTFNALCEQPPAPPGWTCTPLAYGDGIACDCGCGVVDPDCRNDDVSSCVRCFDCGGDGICANTLDPKDSTRCAPPPKEWICSVESWRDRICDCGCGLLDSQCQDIPLRYPCTNFPIEGCAAGHREHIDPSDNSRCIINVPGDWTCDRSYYFDGVCDCGCGAPDLDCRSNNVADCETCDGSGSCSGAACPGSIAPNDAAHCTI